MAEQNSVVAAEVGISREEQDAWALRSHERAVAAIDGGRFAEEIAPVTIQGRKGATVVDTDEGPRRDTSLERLAALKPVFVADGSTTAGNAPGVNDGAAALVLASEELGEGAGDHAARGDPRATGTWPTTTPTWCGRRRRRRGSRSRRPGLAVSDIDLLEVNEAFCSVALNTIRLLGIDEERVNVNGGAVALGHPIGASGARLLGTLIYELRRRGGGIGVAAICSGAAQGDATVLEVFPA